MKARTNFDRNNVYKEGSAVEQLPVDKAYVCKIKSAKVEENTYGEKLVIALDITEGDYKDYYQNRFNADKERSEDAKWKGVVRINIPVDKSEDQMTDQEKWSLRSFNTQIVAIEDSNPGYSWDWDEKKLVGKVIGLVLRNKEWEFRGNTGWFSEPYKLINVEDARANKFRKVKDKPLSNNSSTNSSDDFVAVDDNSATEIPF